MKVVVVESPAKAKTINRYLGDDYAVIASVGHIRDLPSKDGSVNPDDDFVMKWAASPRSTEPVSTILKALKGASKLILATDPDREGEAISWHILEVMEQKKALTGISVERVVFNEITKTAILDAMKQPRMVNTELVEAYLARRALDYLVGFGISPILWRKLPGARSAGRVQSVALKLICERETEIEAFNPIEYWSVEAVLKKQDGAEFMARVTHLDGKKLDKHTLAGKADSQKAVDALNASSLTVETVETRRQKRNPHPPFTTSTLQQEASRKLGFSASRTMRIAQKLYEGVNIGAETTGLITYMRTDGVQIGQEAITSIRKAIDTIKGKRYVPTTPCVYKSRAANAQEAHEAIRPTDIMRQPRDIASFLDDDQKRLYGLIWQRTIASQMQSAEIDMTSADIVDRKGTITLRANGSVIVFDGFLSVYRESLDDGGGGKTEDDDKKFLPPMASGEPIALVKPLPEQHFTQPPPRYTDASLVKNMEELGIGRPSTYASIISVLQDRNYVNKDKGRFTPEDRGRIVSAFLESFFTRYIEYGFTARLEEDLDRVSDGKLEWKTLLHSFWKDFKKQVESMDDLSRSDVLDKVNVLLETAFFPKDEKGQPQRQCRHCDGGMLGLQMGRYGAYIGCSNYPDCKYTSQVGQKNDDSDHDSFVTGEKLLGSDPESGMEIFLKKGPYGLYVQQGGGDVKKPKRSSLPRNMQVASIELEQALALLALPRDVGAHPENGEMITAGLGRYGPYLKYGGNYVSIPDDESVLTVGINHAVEIIAKSGQTPARSLGQPEGAGEINVKSGRFGPYVEQDGVRATIPKSFDPETLTLEEAIGLIEAKKARPPRGKFAKKSKTGTKTGTKAKAKKSPKKKSPKAKK